MMAANLNGASSSWQAAHAPGEVLLPRPRADKSSPIPRMRAEPSRSPVRKQFLRGIPDRVGGACAVSKALRVKLMHVAAAHVVVHRPQSHDHRARPGHAESSLQTQHALAVVQLARAGI